MGKRWLVSTLVVTFFVLMAVPSVWSSTPLRTYLTDVKDVQFVVITHNPRTIEAADWIYGVTMEEPGVSTIVGVRLQEALEQAKGAA